MSCSFDSKSNGDSGNHWVKNTRLYRHWEEMKREIQLHKWYESEKAGYDIGWERAAIDWMIRYGTRHETSKDESP